MLALIRAAFSYMDGRIDPPSSMHRLDLGEMRQQAETAEIWAIDDPVRACVVLTPKQDALYIGKLAVDADHRGGGLSRRLMDLAETRARELHLSFLELQTRVELTENQRIFEAMGFERVGETTHAGYERPTSLTYRRPVRGD